ncbi:hypothetical protein VFPPC_16107 [Pochonia chlamydosporia 170]|uniref:Uncharacterized protein n=1 Tax=Pochonia chlamydosporia 170 TaxID=1380566 RepID=A0A179FN54_METCM|nr:hypothetical protein VFPPC_16107 [Pochonia chlamydosporia 170]OAQ67046.1 hypothetical protein VFPPC_16107 [Pochonia chlamydosporia 170]
MGANQQRDWEARSTSISPAWTLSLPATRQHSKRRQVMASICQLGRQPTEDFSVMPGCMRFSMDHVPTTFHLDNIETAVGLARTIPPRL